MPSEQASEGGCRAHRLEGVVGEDGGAGEAAGHLLEDEEPGAISATISAARSGLRRPSEATPLWAFQVATRRRAWSRLRAVLVIGGSVFGENRATWNRALPQAREIAARPAQRASALRRSGDWEVSSLSE